MKNKSLNLSAEPKKIAVLGSGAWGTAIACAAARANNDVTILCRDDMTVNSINQDKQNPKYLPNIVLRDSFHASLLDKHVLANADIIFICVPVQSIADSFSDWAEFVLEKTVLINTSKGIYQKTGQMVSEVLAQRFPNNDLGILSGPSFAIDVCQNQPTAVTIAAKTKKSATKLCKIMSSDSFRCYASKDIRGVEVGGALKNVLAICAGIVRGKNLGDSAQFAMITRGFVELQRIGVHLGGKRRTMAGLSGLGDLMLSCSSESSRNYSYGIKLAQMHDMSDHPLAEGVFTTKIAHKIAMDNNIDAPIIAGVNAILNGEASINDAIQALMSRPLKLEKQR